MQTYKGYINMTIGTKLQFGGLWLGAHYSKYNRRLCINLIPCMTIWICLEGGKIPTH